MLQEFSYEIVFTLKVFVKSTEMLGPLLSASQHANG